MILSSGFDAAGRRQLQSGRLLPFHVLGAWLAVFGAGFCDCVLVVGIESGNRSLCDLPDTRPVGDFLKSRSVGLGEAQVESGETIGDGGDEVWITLAESQVLKEPVQRNVGLRSRGFVSMRWSRSRRRRPR